MSNYTGPLYLTDADVQQLLDWDVLVKIIEKAMQSASQNDGKSIVQPPRTIMPVPGKNGVLLTMPGFSNADNALACKVVTSFPGNREKGMGTILGTILLLDPDTGKIQAIIEATEITAQRTAAASVVATKYLHNECNVLAVLGSGTQARHHVSALSHCFDIKEIRVWNRRKEGAERLVADSKNLGIPITACSSAQDAVKDADVIVTATYASSPILKREWVKPGVHINAIGAGINHHSELDVELYQEASIYTDTMSGAQVELRGLSEIGVPILGEIGEIIQGTKHVQRENITVFHSLGMAVEDVVTAKVVFDRYKIKNIPIL